MNYYQRFIDNYSNVVRPLLDLIKKDKVWHWSSTCQKAFKLLKQKFLSEPVLSLPDNSKPFAITTNTSKHASGGILLQADSNGNWHPCSYLFQSFSPTKRIYDIYDRELLAIIQGLKTCTTTCMDLHSQYKYSPTTRTSCILINLENSTDDKHNG